MHACTARYHDHAYEFTESITFHHCGRNQVYLLWILDHCTITPDSITACPLECWNEQLLIVINVRRIV